MRYSHKVFIYRRRFHLLFTILLSLLVVGVLIVFIKLAQISVRILIFDLLASSYRVTTAYLISLILAILLALIVTKNKFLEDILLPLLDVLQSFPSFAILPIAILWFGPSSLTAIIFLVITILWPVLFTIIAGIKNVSGDASEAATVFGAKGLRRIWYFLMPAVLPEIVTGSILGWGNAWEAIVGAEIIGISRGIGAFLNDASHAGQTRILVVGIVSLLFFVFFLNKLIWLPLLKHSTRYSTEE